MKLQLHPSGATTQVAVLSNDTDNQLQQEPSGINYEEFTVTELKSLAKEKGIERYSDMKKAELISVLSRG